MRTFVLCVMLLVLGSGAAAGLWPAWHAHASTSIQQDSKDNAPAPDYRYLGSASCNNQSCHGQTSSGMTGREYQIWSEKDPHAKSLTVLHNEVSANIMRVLRKHDASRPEFAYQDQSCLNCHAISYSSPGTETKAAATALTEAVSCEACHGPAERWLTEHYLSTWKTRSQPEKKQSFGFQSTKDLRSRLENCTSCHIGATGREVTHDLIAAGHPRLAYEYTRFHYAADYGKHWVEKMNNPEFEMRAWFISQISCMRAAIGLLKSRLEEQGTVAGKRIWPELAESSCFSCHHEIGHDRTMVRVRSQSGKPAERHTGLPGWNRWYFSLLDVLEGQTPLLFPEANAPKLTALRELLQLMRSMSNKSPQLLELATSAETELLHWQDQLQNLKLNTQAGRQLLSAIVMNALTPINDSSPTSLRESDWDFAAQHYLASAAIVHAHVSTQPSALWNQAKEMVSRLGQAVNIPDGYSSPRDYQPEKAASLFKELRQLADSGSK